MTRIDFYILEDVNLAAQYRFACRLAAKALAANGQKVVVHARDEESARQIDEMLWDYPDKRFVPHALQGEPQAQATDVLITWQEPPHFDGVLVNLALEVPEFFNRFHRVAEVVVGENRDQGRERYRFYRHRGYPLYDHKLTEWESTAG